jgi:hypothetical protein
MDAFTIVTIYLLLIAIILFIICLVGGKKNNLSDDYDAYADQVNTHMSAEDAAAAEKALKAAEEKDK